MTSVTFIPASVKSKALAPLYRHEKRLKSCMCYKKYIIFTIYIDIFSTRASEVPVRTGTSHPLRQIHRSIRYPGTSVS